MRRYHRYFLLPLALPMVLAACETPTRPTLAPLPLPQYPTAIATPRIDGGIGTLQSLAAPQSSIAAAPVDAARPVQASGAGGVGNISLDFADTDIREVVAQVLGNWLKLNYTIDPAVRGNVTLRTATPIDRSQLLPTLQALLAQSGASLVQAGGLYRVVPAANAAGASGLATDAGAGGNRLVPLRYAAAEDLAKVLQPFAVNGARVVADASRNALLVGGDPTTREALVQLIASFDVNVLASQSYTLLPVGSGDARDVAQGLQEALRAQQGGAMAGVIRVVPMQRINAVLVVAPQPRLIEDARRLFGLVESTRRRGLRGWNVFYLQNGKSDDVVFVLQQAFTPDNITVQPSQPGGASSSGTRQRFGMGSGRGGSGGGGGIGAGGIGLGRGGLVQSGQGGGPGQQMPGQGQPGVGPGSPPAGPPGFGSSGNPLLGGLGGGAGGSGGEPIAETMRIIPNQQNNAVLVFGTPTEASTVQAMLRKIDILPLQVRIDATIAEVTLNDNLRFGTQFFFRSGGLNGALSFGNGVANGVVSAAAAGAAAFAAGTPAGFVLSDRLGSQYAIDLLQQVTQVQVLSSPQLMVLDNEPARLQVGSLVPFLTQSAQSTLTTGAPIVNSVDYRETGVIMEVTPRVNSGGLVTLDIMQEVSDVDTAAPATGIASPTFLQRAVRSRVVVQDGQTIGLAGLIRDTSSRGNQGIPFIKDIPLIGALFGAQSNTRQRTELIVLITPRVVHDQRDARALTEDLRDNLINAAAVPGELRALRPSGSTDPNARIRRRVREELERN